MSPPNRQNVPQISKELGIHRSTLYQWRSNWRLQGEVVPASEKDPESWSAANKFTVVIEKLRGQDQREIKALKGLQGMDKAMAEMAALLKKIKNKWEAYCSRVEEN